MELTPTAMEDTDTLARGLLMLSLRLMPLSSMVLMDILDMLLPPMPMDTLDTPMPMVPTLTPMVPDTLARDLLMLSLRLMPLSSMVLMVMVDTLLLPMPMDTPLATPMPMVPTPTAMELTPTMDKFLL